MKCSHADLLMALDYNQQTGVFTWRISCGSQKIGARAGFVDRGYVIIRFQKRNYRANQLAYFYMTEKWVERVDHKNRAGTDNCWDNLREADNSQNQANQGLHCDAKTPLKGVTQRGKYRRYRARIVVKGREIHLGMFATPDEAHAAYAIAAKKHFGEFARAQ